eukprot:Awhi_evm3s2661
MPRAPDCFPPYNAGEGNNDNGINNEEEEDGSEEDGSTTNNNHRKIFSFETIPKHAGQGTQDSGRYEHLEIDEEKMTKMSVWKQLSGILRLNMMDHIKAEFASV